MDANPTQLTVNQNPAPRFPNAVYKLRCNSEPSFQKSKKGNDMLVFTFECLGMYDPKTGKVDADILIDGQTVDIFGWEFTYWATFFEDEKTGQRINPSLARMHKGGGLPDQIVCNPDTGLPEGITYTGVEVWARCQSTEQIQTDKEGKPLLSPLSGKPLKFYQRNLNEIICE